jgi:hypothetical protein
MSQVAELNLSDQNIDDYLEVAYFAISKGTANVTAADKKKLRPLMRHYAKMKHPFTACVRDNRKRFGSHTEEYCAVLKDLIVGNTKWRGKGKKFTPRNLSEDFFTPNDFLTDIGFDDPESIPEDFLDFLNNITEEQIEAITSQSIAENETFAGETADFSEEPNMLAEMYFEDDNTVSVEDGVIWKTIMREGTWKYSPGPGQRPVARPITVTKSGTSDANKFQISLEELKENFDKGVKDHVTIPLSHDDRVHENTGYIKALKIDQDSKGRAVLKAAHEFTDKAIKGKVLEGSIANVSAGILFDYVKKDTGDKFNAILGHSALTNSPWLNDMEDFRKALNAGEDLEILSFSEESGDDTSNADTTAQNEGGVIVSTVETPEVVETKPSFFDEIGMSEDAVRERLARYEAVEAENKKNRIDAKLAAWQSEGKAPAVLKAAEDMLLADTGEVAVNFSENGGSVSLTLSEVVDRLVAASPEVKLDQEVVAEENLAGEKPADDTSGENDEFSLAERTEIGVLMLDQGYSEEAAINEIRSARDSA